MYSDATIFFDQDKDLNITVKPVVAKEDDYFIVLQQSGSMYAGDKGSLYSNNKFTMTMNAEQIKALIVELAKAI